MYNGINGSQGHDGGRKGEGRLDDENQRREGTIHSSRSISNISDEIYKYMHNIVHVNLLKCKN